MKPAILFDKLYLPTEELPEEIIINLRDMLTVENPMYAEALKYSPYGKVGKSIPKFLTFYDDSNPEYFAIPRGTDLKILPQDQRDLIHGFDITDRRMSFRQKMPVLPEETLNEQQHEVLLHAVEGMTNDEKHGECLVVLPVSSGKTRVGLYAATLLQQRTLILCDTNLIAKGWQNEINKIFGWKPRKKSRKKKKFEIANKYLPNIGIVQQDKLDFGRYFTICSWQTVNRRGTDFWDNLSKHHGFLIVDEAEVCPSKTFIKFVSKFAGKHKLAITGTDYRKDGLESVLFFEFGNPYIKKVSTNVETGTSLPISDIITVRTGFRYTWSKGGYDHNDYEAECSQDEERVSLICDKIEDQHKKGHNCLVAALHKGHVKAIHKELAYRGYGNVSVMATGGLDDEIADKLLAGVYEITVATVSYVYKGANCPKWDRLFLVSLVKDERTLNQLFGRVRRKCEGKEDVVVYEFVDPARGMIAKSYHQRNNVYASMGIKKFKDIIYI